MFGHTYKHREGVKEGEVMGAREDLVWVENEVCHEEMLGASLISFSE